MLILVLSYLFLKSQHNHSNENNAISLDIMCCNVHTKYINKSEMNSTNQDEIGLKEIFRGCIVKSW